MSTSTPWLGRMLALAPALLIVMALAVPGEQPTTDADTVAQVVKSWAERQATVRSYDFQMTGTEFIPQTSISATELQGAGQAIDAEPFKLPDTSFEVKMRLATDADGRVRLDIHDQTWSAKDKKYIPESTIGIDDGQVRKVFIEQGSMGFPNAHISNGRTSSQTSYVGVLPLMMVYRPLDGAGPEFDPVRLKLAPGTGVAEGRECLILQSGETTIWVDAGRGFLPTRYYEYRSGKPHRSIEMRYAADAERGWVPAGWTNAAFGGSGQVTDSVTVKVTEQHLNTPIPDDLFDVKYPPGTWVHNYITDKEYIIRDGDNTRPIQPGEFDGKNYDQLLHSEPPGQTFRGGWFYTILGVNLAILVGICLLVYYRRRRRRTT